MQAGGEQIHRQAEAQAGRQAGRRVRQAGGEWVETDKKQRPKKSGSSGRSDGFLREIL